MYESSRLAQITKEMECYDLGILGISECRWTGQGRFKTSDGYTVLYSGNNKNHVHGVAIIIRKTEEKSLIEWEPISERIIRARFNSKYTKMTVIQSYAPTNEKDQEDKEEFYDALQTEISKTPQHDLLLPMGDMNAKVGKHREGIESVIDSEGTGETNENGEMLINCCQSNGLVIGGTLFPHKEIHKLTWTSPDGRTKNMIDHIIINRKWVKSMRNVRVYRRADVGSDHHLL